MLSCQQYDYIEIASMYRYPVRLTLKSGATSEGIALDTCRNEQNQECIELEHNNQTEKVVLDQLAQMEVLVANPNFRQVYF